MRFTYLFLGFVILLFFILLTKSTKLTRAQLLSLLVLIGLTTIFNQFIISLDIVRYNLDNITGLFIGFIPIEDYLYCLGAIIVVPWLWKRLSDD